MKRIIKVKEFSDGSLLILPHQYHKSKPKLKEKPLYYDFDFNSPPPHYFDMSSRDYSLLLKRNYKKLFDKELFMDNPYFFTLTTSNYISVKDLLKKLHNFFVNLNRHFGKFEYLRTIEYNRSRLLHLHLLVCFYNKPVELNGFYVEKHLWKLGFVCVREVSSFMGVIEYLTTYKKNNLQPLTKRYTLFSKGTKIISMSKNFIIGKKEYKEYTIDINHYNKIINDTQDIEKYGGFKREDFHHYFDEENQESKKCIDRIYIRHKA